LRIAAVAASARRVRGVFGNARALQSRRIEVEGVHALDHHRERVVGRDRVEACAVPGSEVGRQDGIETEGEDPLAGLRRRDRVAKIPLTA